MDNAGVVANHASRRRLVVLLAIAFAGIALLAWRWITAPNVEPLLAKARRDWTANAFAADQNLERAIDAADGSLPLGHLLRCRLRLELQRPADAIAYIDAFGEAMAEDPVGLLDLAAAARSMTQPDVAARLATLVPAGTPHRAEALRLAVSAELDLGMLEPALRHAEEWSNTEPSNPEAKLATARVQRRQSRLIPSIHTCREAVRIATALPGPDQNASGDSTIANSALRELVELLVTARDADGARQAFDQLADRTSDRDELTLMEAYILRLEGSPDEALAKVERACQSRPQSIEARFLRSVILIDAKRFADASNELKQVVRREPFHKEAHYKLALALQRLGQIDAASEHFNTSARLTKLAEEQLALQGQVTNNPDPAKYRRLAEISAALGRDREAAFWRSQADAK